MRGEVQRAGIPQISMAGGTVVTGEFDPLVFQTPWSNTLVVPYVLAAIKDAGHTKIAVISDTGGYGKDGVVVIKEQAPELGLAIVADETFNPGDSDVTAQLTKVKATDAQAVLLWTAGKEGAIALKNARDLGVDLPFYGGSGQARTEFAEGAGAAAEGFVFGTGKSLVPENWGQNTEEYAVVSDFATRYEEAYGEAPDIFAGHAFDAVTLLADALGRAGDDPDATALRDALEKTEGVVGFGGTFTFSPDDHNGLTQKDLALYKIQGGKWILAP
ncbi:MAG TPA: ABC transporter substrate-binding protein [Thermoleophilia bacterium]|nr:ABC transporter substrate-binding protein [Thermoleophilia bacterium]